jgi:hypothetical protein
MVPVAFATMSPSHGIIVVIWTFKMRIWIELWSNITSFKTPSGSFVIFICSVVAGVLIVNTLVLVPFVIAIPMVVWIVINANFITIFVSFHFLIELVWINTFPFFGVINVVEGCFVTWFILVLEAFQSFIFEILWHESCDHILVHIVVFNIVRSAVNNFFFAAIT